MSQGSVITAPVARSSLEWDYEYDKNNDVFLFYPSCPVFESSTDDVFPQYPMGFYNLPVFRNDGEKLTLPLRPPESVCSDRTAVAYADEGLYGREGDVLRSMGYSRCLCLGLTSIDASNCLRPAATQDVAAAAQDRIPLSFCGLFTRLWDRFLRR